LKSGCLPFVYHHNNRHGGSGNQRPFPRKKNEEKRLMLKHPTRGHQPITTRPPVCSHPSLSPKADVCEATTIQPTSWWCKVDRHNWSSCRSRSIKSKLPSFHRLERSNPEIKTPALVKSTVPIQNIVHHNCRSIIIFLPEEKKKDSGLGQDLASSVLAVCVTF